MTRSNAASDRRDGPGPQSADPMIRKTISLPESEWARAADFRFRHRLGTESEASRRIYSAGLDALEAMEAKERRRKAARGVE